MRLSTNKNIKVTMFKQEDYIIQSPDDPNIMENYVILPSEGFRLCSQEFDLNINELIPEMLAGLTPSPQTDEATMDIASKIEPIEFIPSSPRGPPDCTEFGGDLNFQVEISASDTHRKKYLYSSHLNRIFVNMKVDFPVSFRWKGHPEALLVRATTVFSDPDQREKRVERCTQHTHDNADASLSPHIVRNVLHSSRSPGTGGVYYCGRAEQADCWYSVLVRLPAVDSGAVGAATHAYQFVCKNSCPGGGINRRSIAIIFTLENAFGHVYGRRIVSARACACPRRDLVRDEAEGAPRAGKKRMARKPPPPPAGKKVKVEAAECDDTALTLPPLEILGVKPLVTGLEVMLKMMEQAAAFRKSDPQATEKYTKCIASLRAKIDDIMKNT